MKLTKGKLSKLFHKKKQTMRRYKNQRKYRRASKTFRQRKPLNLHRSSMKKIVDPRKVEWIGGTDPDEKVPLVVKPASEETTEVPTQEKTTTFTLGSDEAPQSTPAPESVPTTEQAPTPTTETAPVPESVPVPDSVPAPESVPTTEQAPEPAPALEPESASEPAPEPEQAPAPTNEIAPEPETTKVDEIPTADAVPKQIDAENVKPESSLAPPSVADALDIIANKIAKAVVKEMRENPTSDSYPNQDADKVVPLAVDALVKQTQLAPE